MTNLDRITAERTALVKRRQRRRNGLGGTMGSEAYGIRRSGAIGHAEELKHEANGALKY